MMIDDRATCIVFSADDLPPEGFDHTCSLYISVVCSDHKVSSVLLDNGFALNVCPLATVVALGFAPSDFGPSTQIANLGFTRLELFHLPFIRRSVTVMMIFFLIGFTFDETGFTPSEDDVRYMERLHRDRVRDRLSGIPFDYLIHPYTFNLADYFVRGSEIQPHVEEIGVEDSTVDELQHMLHQMQMGDETVGVLASMTIAPPSPDRANLFSLCFPNETNYGVVIEPADIIDGVVLHDEYHDEMDILGISQFLDVVQREPFSPLELFGVSVIKIADEDWTVPAHELPTFVVPTIDMYEGTIGPIERTSDFVDPSLSFDILSGFVTCSDYVSDYSVMDFSIYKYFSVSYRDSFDHDSDPIDKRVSPATGNVETVDFSTDDQPIHK
ncbi:hypothetical protein CK203_086297 [Vitis vinifera]|uniref:Uncharacterized protein n=1 Tax=Vitis vinifera TaxID=29760 RepID=A0A438EDT5_VITVI|nr:hypothetical protein CK203_086297 [Vitis vinifera]